MQRDGIGFTGLHVQILECIVLGEVEVDLCSIPK